MDHRRLTPLVLLAALPLALTGCGDRSTGSAPTGAWTHVGWSLSPGPDSSTVLAAGDGELVGVTTDDDGTLTSTVVTDDGATDGAPLETGRTYALLGGVAAFDGGYVAIGSGGLLDRPGYDDDLLFDPFVVTSAEGVHWSPVRTTGLDGPVDVTGLVVDGDTLVAVGVHRGARDPSTGGFTAAVWTSTDSRTWTERVVPTEHRGSGLRDVAVAGDDLLAVGADGDSGTVLRSEDDGATWSSVDLGDAGSGLSSLGSLGSLGSVAADGGTVVVTAEGAGEFLRSPDGGTTWRVPSAPPPGGDYAPALDLAGGQWWAWVSQLDDSPSVAECYAEPDDCGRDLGGLYTSDDGDDWQRVDDAGLRGDALDSGPAATAPDGGTALVDAEGVSLLPAGTRPATTAEPTPVRADVTEVPASGPEVGVRYAAPLYVHCGSEWLYLGRSEQVWRRTDHRGDVPASWPGPEGAGVVYGYATLTSDDELEYSADDGTVLATYERSDDRPPGCD